MRKVKKLWFNWARFTSFLTSRLIDMGHLNFHNPCLTRFEQFEEATKSINPSSEAIVGYGFLIEMVLLEYKYGEFLVEPERMKKFILNTQLDNFDKLKYLRELYLI